MSCDALNCDTAYKRLWICWLSVGLQIAPSACQMLLTFNKHHLRNGFDLRTVLHFGARDSTSMEQFP